MGRFKALACLCERILWQISAGAATISHTECIGRCGDGRLSQSGWDKMEYQGLHPLDGFRRREIYVNTVVNVFALTSKPFDALGSSDSQPM